MTAAKKKADSTGFYDPNAPAAGPVTAAKSAPRPKAPKKAAAAPSSALPHLTALQPEQGRKDLSADAGFVEGGDDRAQLLADIARIRTQRKPFGAFTQKLAYPARPGYHRHWFSDEPGRVDEATSNGWAHVKSKGETVRRVVGRARDGGPMFGYLMELPEIFWNEDMAAKHDAAQARIDEIKKNPFRSKPGQAQQSDQGKFYSASDEPVAMSETLVRSRPKT